MANNLATLETELALKLRDASHAVWTQAENNDLLTRATARMYPQHAKTVQELVTLVSAQESYTLTTVADVSRVDLISSTSPYPLQTNLMGGTWEFWPTPPVGGSLFLNSSYSDTSYRLRVHGYAPYDLATNLPPDKLVPAILGAAGAEAVRRMMNDRAKFKQWDTISQNQNISVNEFIGMVNEGDTEWRQAMAQSRTWRRPKPATR